VSWPLPRIALHRGLLNPLAFDLPSDRGALRRQRGQWQVTCLTWRLDQVHCLLSLAAWHQHKSRQRLPSPLPHWSRSSPGRCSHDLQAAFWNLLLPPPWQCITVCCIYDPPSYAATATGTIEAGQMMKVRLAAAIISTPACRVLLLLLLLLVKHWRCLL